MPEISVPVAVQTVTTDINISLNQIFILIETRSPKSIEFAVWFKMDGSASLRDMFPFRIEDGYLMVWNTGRKVILDKMRIAPIRKLLCQ